jgi:hypothetical protein
VIVRNYLGWGCHNWSVKDGLDWEALEGIFGFFQVAYQSMVYLLTPSTFFPDRTYFMYNHTSSSCFSMRGGTTGRSCEGWMGPIPLGTHVASVSHHVLLYVVVPHWSHVRDGWDLIQREPTAASVSCHVLPYVDIPHCEYARQGSTSFKKERIWGFAVHAAVWRMDIVSISERYCMWALPWPAGTEGSFLQVHNSASLVVKWIPSSSRLVIIGRDE